VETTAPAIFEIGFVLLVAAIAGWLARRAGLPAVLGYLATGLLVSPFTPGYVADRHQLQVFADVGVVLLLFEVGIELDVAELGRERGSLFWPAPSCSASASRSLPASLWSTSPAAGGARPMRRPTTCCWAGASCRTWPA